MCICVLPSCVYYNTLEPLELPTVVSCQVVLGTGPGPPARTANAPKPWALLLRPLSWRDPMDNMMFQISLTRKRKHRPLLGNQQKRQRLGAIGADVGKEDFFHHKRSFCWLWMVLMVLFLPLLFHLSRVKWEVTYRLLAWDCTQTCHKLLLWRQASGKVSKNTELEVRWLG